MVVLLCVVYWHWLTTGERPGEHQPGGGLVVISLTLLGAMLVRSRAVRLILGGAGMVFLAMTLWS